LGFKRVGLARPRVTGGRPYFVTILRRSFFTSWASSTFSKSREQKRRLAFEGAGHSVGGLPTLLVVQFVVATRKGVAVVEEDVSTEEGDRLADLKVRFRKVGVRPEGVPDRGAGLRLQVVNQEGVALPS